MTFFKMGRADAGDGRTRCEHSSPSTQLLIRSDSFIFPLGKGGAVLFRGFSSCLEGGSSSCGVQIRVLTGHGNTVVEEV